MFVLTVDQVDSRTHDDAVPAVVDALVGEYERYLVRLPERTAGDEFQTALEDPDAALDACLFLTRDGHWSVGCGVGPVETPLPEEIRAAKGPAFVAARRAVDAAKKSATHCAVRVATDYPFGEHVGPLLDLLLALRGRRTPEGWEVYDLLGAGHLTQRKVAERLGISEQAVSARARAADLRVEEAARRPLAVLLSEADAWVGTA